MLPKRRSTRSRSSRSPLARQLDDALGKPPKQSKAKPVQVPVEGDLLRLHRPSGQGYVLVGKGHRRRIYVGPFYDPDGRNVSHLAMQEARRLLRDESVEALPPLRPERATGRAVARALRAREHGVTVSELAERYLEHVRKKYARRETQIPHYETAIRRLVHHAGDVPAIEFGPLMLRSLRGAMLLERDPRDDTRSRYVRRYVNETARRITRAYKWAVSVELVPETVYRALLTVEPVEAGEVVRWSDSDGIEREIVPRESKKVEGVPLDDVRAILPHLSRQVRAVVLLQVLTGARPSELLGLRPMDIDRSGERWIARPVSHKNAWRGKKHERELPLPHEAESVLRPFIESRLPSAPLFSPREAEQDRLAERHAQRKVDSRFGNSPGYNSRTREGRDPKKAPGETYTADSYRRAIERACAFAGVERFTPYRLRHVAGEITEAALDETHASAVLGHRDTQVTQRYHRSTQRRIRAATAVDVLGLVVAKALGLEESA